MSVKTRSQKQQEKLEAFSKGPEIPEDVQDCWFEVAKRAQAACSGNNGYGLMTLTVVVNKGKAVMWLPPDIEKIEPARISIMEMSAETVVGLTAIASKNGGKR